jgi:hypothetical protein
VPSRKQRRRREKTFRHEYETVVIDEEGNELPVDREQVRADREEREKQRTRGKKAAPAKRGRVGREPPPPSWRRALRRGGLMGLVIFFAFVFILKGGSTVSRAAIAVVYGAAFIPLTYWIDRIAYRSFLRRQERQQKS